MTEKRFTIGDRALQEVYGGCIPAILDGGIPCTQSQVLHLLNELNDENEQLQARNDRQANSLDELYNLIEKQDWEALKQIIQDFKDCEEQLQKEWRKYDR